MNGSLAVTGDPQADRLLNTNPFALLLGMLLDQQVPMEWAFSSPLRLQDRLGAPLDAAAVAALDPDKVVELFAAKPSLHRYPKSMGQRAHALAQHLVDEYGGDTEAVWRDASDGPDLLRRLRALPGFGEEKGRIFSALLAKRFGTRPPAWEEAAGPFADARPRSVADIDGPAALEKVREYKKILKGKGLGKGGKPNGAKGSGG